jgi:hypothetical protein
MAANDNAKRAVLDALVLTPAFKRAARHAEISHSTLFRWLRASVAEPDKNTLVWLGHEAPFHLHANAARKFSTVALDHSARDLAINGHVEPRWHGGEPVWKRDPQVAADAVSMKDDEWELRYGDRPRSDTFARDPKTGAFIQDTIIHPPNPQLLVKMLTSLAPELYGERSEITVNHTGSVWIEGGNSAAPAGALPAPHDNFKETFGLTQRPGEVARKINVLAVPRPCVDSAEFDSRFARKLLREVTLFRDKDNKLLPPLPDDVVVAGSPQHRAFSDAGYQVEAVRAELLIDEGYENDFLKKLAPGYMRKVPEVEKESVRIEAAKRMVQAIKAGKASADYDSENIGRGNPAPGGRRVQL